MYALVKGFRGGFNQTHGAALAGHVIRSALEKANVDPALVDDVFMGCGMPEAETGAVLVEDCYTMGHITPSLSAYLNRHECREECCFVRRVPCYDFWSHD